MYDLYMLRFAWYFENCICLSFDEIPYIYLFNLKKKVRNKTHVEALMCKTYIVEEILTFILYYFKPHLRTRINRIPRHDGDGKVTSNGNLLIFSHLRWLLPKIIARGRYLIENKSRHAYSYVLFNYNELRPFI
jgi:hypothetical protein